MFSSSTAIPATGMPTRQEVQPRPTFKEEIIAHVCSRLELVSQSGGCALLGTLLEEVLCDNLNRSQSAVFRLAELLKAFPETFQQLNPLFQPRGVRVELAQCSPISCFVFKTPEISRIMCLDTFRDSLKSFHNFSTTQLCRVLLNAGDPMYDELFKVTNTVLRDCLAQLAQDVLETQGLSGTCRRATLGFLRRCGGIPPSLFLPGLEEGDLFFMTALSDLYKGTLDGRQVVIKKPRYSKSSFNNIEIMREVILYRQCRHPHILAFLGVSEEPNRFYGLVTPFMKNGNVAQFLKKNPHVNRLTPVWQIMQGLAYLHSFDPPIAHRDVKGTNVLVDDDFNCRLADLGLSSIPELSQRSREQAFGTPAWMAPEILLPPEDGRVDLFKVDVFALGITIFEVIEGKPPVPDTSLYGVVAARLVNKETLTFTSNLFPPLLTRIAKAMLDIHPLNRPDVSTSIQQFEKGLLFPKKMVLSKERDAVQIQKGLMSPSRIPRPKPGKPRSTAHVNYRYESASSCPQPASNNTAWPPQSSSPAAVAKTLHYVTMHRNMNKPSPHDTCPPPELTTPSSSLPPNRDRPPLTPPTTPQLHAQSHLSVLRP